MSRSLLVAAGTAVMLAAAACGADNGPPPSEASGPVIQTEEGTATPYGTDARQVWVLRPRKGRSTNVVVYLHGFGAYLPFEWHIRWLDHLLENGSTVIFPRYQAGDDDPFLLMRFDLAEGLKTGFEAAGYKNEPVVVAGFSLGATLAFDYAARAGEWGVPAPRAVYSIFPVDPSLVDPALDVSTIEQTRVLVLVGADDHVVGQEGADELVNGLSGLPPSLKQLRVIRTSDELLADHEAPTFVDNPVTQETFWTPLDELIQKARSSNASP